MSQIEEQLDDKSLDYVKNYILEVLCDLIMWDDEQKLKVQELLTHSTSSTALIANIEKSIEIFIQDRYTNPYALVVS